MVKLGGNLLQVIMHYDFLLFFNVKIISHLVYTVEFLLYVERAGNEKGEKGKRKLNREKKRRKFASLILFYCALF